MHALAGESRESRRRAAHPLRQLIQGIAASRRAGPGRRQRDLQRRDAAPGPQKIAGVEMLHRRQAMANDRRRPSGSEPSGQRGPQPFAVVALAERRRALERGGAVRNVLGRERQVVRTGLGGERQTRGVAPRRSSAARRTRRGERCACGRHIGGTARSAARWPRSRPPSAASRDRSRTGADRSPRTRALRGIDRTGQLRVREQRRAKARQNRHRRAQVGFADRRELVDARRHQKALEPERAGGPERLELGRRCPARRRPRTRHRRSTSRPPRAASPSNASTLVVAGMLFSGISTIVVTPPAAAARVAVSKPSQSVRPGSLMWTWVSTTPGITTEVSGVIQPAAGGHIVERRRRRR